MVTVFDARPHGFETGDLVEFKEVEGMMELNGRQREVTGTYHTCNLVTPFNHLLVPAYSYSFVVVISPYQFTVTGISQFSPYTGGGIAAEVKQPKTLQFVSQYDYMILELY